MVAESWPCMLYGMECVAFIAPLMSLAIYHCRIVGEGYT